MRWYKILARILLMLFVIDFALAAPVVAQIHEVRVSVVETAKGGTATSPLRRDPWDKWLGQMRRRPRDCQTQAIGPRQYNNPTDSNGSPERSNPAPVDLNTRYSSPSPPPGSTSPLPTSQAP